MDKIRSFSLICVMVLVGTHGLFLLGFALETPPTEGLLEGDWNKAIKILEQTNTKSLDPVTKLLMGHASIGTNRNNNAMRLFLSVRDQESLTLWAAWTRKFLDKNNQSPIALYLAADAKARKGNLLEAEVLLNQALNKKDFALAYMARGVVRTLQNKHQAALFDFLDATQLNPNLADAWANLGIYWIRQKAAPGALKAFQQALNQNPEFALAHHARGATFAGIGKNKKAAKDFTRFLQLTTSPARVAQARDVSRMSQKRVVLYFTDFGINQWENNWKDKLPMGVTLVGEGKNQAFPDLPATNQILIPMPSDEEFDHMSTVDLSRWITDTVLRRINEGVKKRTEKVDTFEIQFVQNINSKGYPLRKRQGNVARFGTAAYGAIPDVKSSLKQQNFEVLSPIIVGSNGAVVLAKNTELIQRGTPVDLFDGRASKEATVDLIRQVGAEQVRLFNTFGDAPAADEDMASDIAGVVNALPLSLRSLIKHTMGGKPAASIANLGTNIEIKKKFPEVKVFLLERIVGVKQEKKAGGSVGEVLKGARLSFTSHIGGMNKEYYERPFIIREVVKVAEDDHITLSRRAVVLGKDLRLRGKALEEKLVFLPLTQEEYLQYSAGDNLNDFRNEAVRKELEILQHSEQVLRADTNPENNRINHKLLSDIREAHTRLNHHRYGWQREAYAEIGLTGEAARKRPIEANKRITAAYARMYLRDPQTYEWAGMAAYASALVGKSLQRAQALREQGGNSGLALLLIAFKVPTGAEILHALHAGNLGVYEDIYWQHVAYDTAGLPALKEANRQGALPEQVLAAWRLIDEGRRLHTQATEELDPVKARAAKAFIREGNRSLLKYEQEEILQKTVYTPHRNAFRWLSSSRNLQGLSSPIPGHAVNFELYLENGDLGNFKDRWSWINHSMQPAWETLQDTDPGRVQRDMQWFIQQPHTAKTRAAFDDDGRILALAEHAQKQMKHATPPVLPEIDYDPDSPYPQPGDFGIRTGSLGTVPHGWTFWGQMRMGDMVFDSIELVKTSEDETRIVPKNWAADPGIHKYTVWDIIWDGVAANPLGSPKSGRGSLRVNWYRPLESEIPVIFQGNRTTLRMLPLAVKKTILSKGRENDVKRLGTSRGKYVLLHPLSPSNQCIDSILAPLDEALKSEGVTVVSRFARPSSLRDAVQAGVLIPFIKFPTVILQTTNPLSWFGPGVGNTFKKVTTSPTLAVYVSNKDKDTITPSPVLEIIPEGQSWQNVKRNDWTKPVSVLNASGLSAKTVVEEVSEKATVLGVDNGQPIVVGGDLENAFVSAQVGEIEAALKAKGYPVVVMDTGPFAGTPALLIIADEAHEVGSQIGVLVEYSYTNNEGENSQRDECLDDNQDCSSQGKKLAKKTEEEEPQRIKECSEDSEECPPLEDTDKFLPPLCPGPVCPDPNGSGIWWSRLCPGPFCPNDDQDEDEEDTCPPDCPPCPGPKCRDNWEPHVYFPEKKPNTGHEGKDKHQHKAVGNVAKEGGVRTQDIKKVFIDRGEWPIIPQFTLFY